MTSISPTISVVVAVHDAEKYLRLNLDTILNQTFPDFEVICVDDGSEDSSLAILREYSEKDSRVKVISQENSGAGAARNAGLRVAKGRYLLFLDSDDFFENNMFETLYYNAEIHDLDVAICQAFQYDDQTERVDKILSWAAQKMKFSTDIFSYEDDPGQIFQYINTWAWNKLIRSSLVFDNDIQFQELMSSNDNLFVSTVLILAKRMMIIDTPLIYYRVNNPNSLQRSKEDTWYCSMEAAYAVGDMILSRGFNEDVERSYLNKSLKNVIYYYESIPYDSPAKPLMMEKIKTEFIPRMGILDHPRDYFYDPIHLDKLDWILNRDYRRSVLPIVFASDNNYAKQMYVTAYSILKNKLESTMIDFYLLIDDGFEEGYVDDIKELASRYPGTSVHAVRMGDRFNSASITIDHITTPTYYRLAMAEVLPAEYDRCLYLDTDIIVTSDLSEYFSLDMDDYYIAGVKAASYIMNYTNWGHMHSIGIRDVNEYVNAGAVLYNLKKIREDNLTQELMRRIGLGYSSQDQDIINAVFSGHILIQPLKCNMMTKYNGLFDRKSNEYRRLITVYSEQEIADAVSHPLIIHYAGPVKPWNGMEQHFADLWWQYADECPYSDYRTVPEEPVPEISNYELKREISVLNKRLDDITTRINSNGNGIKDLKKSVSVPNSNPGPDRDVGSSLAIAEVILKNGGSVKDALNLYKNLQSGRHNDALFQIARIYLDKNGKMYNPKLAEFYLQLSLQEGNNKALVMLLDLLWSYSNEEKDALAFGLAEHSDDPAVIGRRARMYRDGKGVPKDSDMAEYLFEKAAEYGDVKSREELVKMLWAEPDNPKKLIEHLLRLSDSGNAIGIAFLSRAYRRGRGVEKDLVKSADLMRSIAGDNVGYNMELFDTLVEMGTEESIRESKIILDRFKNSDNERVIKRLGTSPSREEPGQDPSVKKDRTTVRQGRADGFDASKTGAADAESAFKLGCGCPDVGESVTHFRKAADAGHLPAARRLILALWRLGTPAALEECISRSETLYSRGDDVGGAVLSRAYRRGRGVEKDLVKSADIMRSVAGDNLGYNMELFDTLVETGSPTAFDEAVHLITSFKDVDNPRVRTRFAVIEKHGIILDNCN